MIFLYSILTQEYIKNEKINKQQNASLNPGLYIYNCHTNECGGDHHMCNFRWQWQL